MLRKYTSEWKLNEIKKKGKISLKTRGRMVKIRFIGNTLFLVVGDKEYTVKNPDTTLKAVANEKDYIEVEIANPDGIVASPVILCDAQIANRIW